MHNFMCCVLFAHFSILAGPKFFPGSDWATASIEAIRSSDSFAFWVDFAVNTAMVAMVASIAVKISFFVILKQKNKD